MTKQIDFEDTIFILNVRIRMIRDLLRLDTDTDIFYNKTIEDLDFIGSVMNGLTEKLLANPRFLDRDIEAGNLAETEWQFSNLLNEFSDESSPFSISRYPQSSQLISKLRAESSKRTNLINETLVTADSSQSEPVVSIAEMSELLKEM